MKKNFLLYFSLILISCTLAFMVNSYDPDFWHRLAVGSLFFQTGGVLKQDIFAYTPTKPLWIDHEWGSGVVFYFIAKHLGYWGILGLKAILIFAILFLIIQIIKLNKNREFRFEILYFILIGYSLYPSVASPVRCQIFTFLFFTLWLYILERIRRGENRLLWILPATSLIWANMHGGFVTGFCLIIAYAIGEALNKRNSLKYVAILIPAVLITLINPYGIEYWHYIIKATTMVRPNILEWGPLNFNDHFVILGFHLPIFAGFAVLAALTVITAIYLFIKKQKPDWVKIILLTAFIYLGIRHMRHAIFLTLTASGLLYYYYLDLFRTLKDKFNPQIQLFISKIKLIIEYGALAALIIYFISLPKELIVSPNQYPVGSFEFIRQNDIKGNILTSYRWGNYALWKLYPHNLVSVDGRYEEVYPDDVFADMMNFAKKLDKNWDCAAKRFPTDVIVAPKYIYREVVLKNKLKDWEIIYSDNVSYLLVPKSKVKKTYIYPDFSNKVYWYENLAKEVDLD